MTLAPAASPEPTPGPKEPSAQRDSKGGAGGSSVELNVAVAVVSDVVEGSTVVGVTPAV